MIRDAANSILNASPSASMQFGEAINILTELDQAQWAYRNQADGSVKWFRMVEDTRHDADPAAA